MPQLSNEQQRAAGGGAAPRAWEVEGADAGGHAQRLADGVCVDAGADALHVLPHQVARYARSILHHLCGARARGAAS